MSKFKAAASFIEVTKNVSKGSGTKRERLIEAAADLVHRQGISATTLADVAERADVPLGNVYYYFKTKDDLVRSVITGQEAQLAALLTALDELHDPADRLKALGRHWSDMRTEIARYGCPFGTITVELDRRVDGMDVDAARPMQLAIEWAQRQFAALGHADARDRALTWFARVQGASVVAAALRDPEVIVEQIRQLNEWIDTTNPPS